MYKICGNHIFSGNLYALLIFVLTSVSVCATPPAQPTEEQIAAQAKGLDTAAGAKALVGINKELAEQSAKSVETLTATRGINETVFKNKNPNQTIEMVEYQIKGGLIVNKKESQTRKDIRAVYEAAYKSALKDQMDLVTATFERDRAASEAQKVANDMEKQRKRAANADEMQRLEPSDKALALIEEVKKDFILVVEQAKLAADRYAEAQALLAVAHNKADASKAEFDRAAIFYVQGNLEIDEEEIKLMREAEKEVEKENKK